MGDLFKKFLRSQFGFSLVQALVAGSMMAGLGLVVAKLGQQTTNNKLVADTNYGIIDVTGRIQILVSNEVSCANSFLPPFEVAPNSTAQVNGLRDANNNPVFVVGSSQANNQVRIIAMTLKRNPENSILTVTMQKNVEGRPNLSQTQIKKEFFINSVWDGNRLVSCSSDITNFMDTVASQALSIACDSGSIGLVRDNKACKAIGQLGPADFTCPAGQSIVALNFDPATRIYTPACKHILSDIPLCAANRLLRRNPDGTFNCVSIDVPTNTLAQGLDTSGNMRYTSCPTGTYMVSTPAGWQCKSASCVNDKSALQQYFAGFDTNGNAICNKLIDGGNNCPAGGRLQSDANGSLSVVCCSDTCGSTAANVCAGTAYPDANNCGTCLGTKPADCSNASNFCVGTKNVSANDCGFCDGTKAPDCSSNGSYCAGQTYSSPNGCGVCPGTKPVDCSTAHLYCNGTSFASPNGCGACAGTKPNKNADWGAWTYTWETRVKPGATCSAACGAGQIATQRKYTRTCLNNQECSGTTCSGAVEEWRDEGTQYCTLGECCTPVTVFSHWVCAKTVPGKNWINNCWYKSVCSENHSRLLSGPWWDGREGPTSASGGDTGTKGNCEEKRRACPNGW